MRTPLYCALLACGLAFAQDHAPLRAMTDGATGPALRAEKADQLLNRANFVFVGTVMQTRASNLSSVPGSARTTLVRVERVLHGTPLLAESTGQVITVFSLRASEHRPGQVSTFFMDIDTFGESLSGMELDRFATQAGDDEAHPRLLATARRAQEDRELNRRMKKAEQVVQGRVVSVEPAGIEERVSEHAAVWQKAVIEVDAVIKGRPDTKTVTLYFPASVDRMWQDAPKFAEGQEGVWLLQARPQDYSRKAAMIPGLTALDPKDFQRADQRERLQRLIENR